MFRKFCIRLFHGMLLTLLVLFTIHSNPVSANSLLKDKPKHFAKATLKNLETKDKIELPVKITEEENNSGQSTTYIVNITSGALSESHSYYDTTAGVKLTVTMYYDEQWVGQHRVAIDRTNARWDKYDNTITISNVEIGSSVWSADPSLAKTESVAIGTPSIGATYVQTPSWRGIFVVVNDFAYQESLANSTLRHGTGSTWSLNLCVSQGGGAIIACE